MSPTLAGGFFTTGLRGRPSVCLSLPLSVSLSFCLSISPPLSVSLSDSPCESTSFFLAGVLRRPESQPRRTAGFQLL